MLIRWSESGGGGVDIQGFIPRGKELDHRTWSYDRAFEQLFGSEMGEFEH